MQDTNKLVASSVLAWVYLNKFVNENRQPIEFTDHRFLIEYMADQCQVKVTKKAAQIGLTVAETLDNFHLAAYMGLNVIHTLQTKDVIKGFVFPKVNPIIEQNPAIKALIKVDSESLKQVGGNFIYYRGANAESQAINISADVLKIDEYDRSNQIVVEMYQSRLDASKYRWRRYFSNPSAIGFGVDELYTKSDQRHWFVTCNKCGHASWLDWEKVEGGMQETWLPNHYVNVQKEIYACGKCDNEITDDDRRGGKWLAMYPTRPWHGYWFSQLMAPWFSARDIIEKHDTTSPDFFYNFVLGKAYTPSDMVVNRETILRATAPGYIPRLNVAIGVDQNVSECIWVAMTPQGVFAHGKAKSWEEIETLKLTYNATVVCDPNPYSTMPKIMANKYSNWYMCYFKQMSGMDIVQWKGSVVYADRTRLLDLVATEIAEAKLLFRESPYALEDYIKDWSNIYRTSIEDEVGKVKNEWMKKEGQLSDYSFATAYARIALSRGMGGGSTFIEPYDNPSGTVTDTVNENGRLSISLGDAVEEALSDMEG